MVTSTCFPHPRGDMTQIAWYENTDGQGTFGDQQVIYPDDSRLRSSTPPTRWRRRHGCPLRVRRRQNRLVRKHRRKRQLRRPAGDHHSSRQPGPSTPRTWTATATWTSSPRLASTTSEDRLVREHRRPRNFRRQQVITHSGDSAMTSTPPTSTATATWMSSPRLAMATIAWYENTDGQGTFGQQQVITRRGRLHQRRPRSRPRRRW